VSERSERALMKTKILAINPAKWLQKATFTTKLTLIIPLNSFDSLIFALASLKMRTISLRSAQHHNLRAQVVQLLRWGEKEAVGGGES